MSITQCSACSYVSSRAINCARCGGNFTMREVDGEKEGTLKAALAATGRTAFPTERETDRDVVISAIETLRKERDGLRAALYKIQAMSGYNGVPQNVARAAIAALGHWPDCGANHGGQCDMGPECGT